ncbi:hypothetical protein [Sphingomonas sp. M1-B02]|uniref:hypothetical protein n=1 Tax=Sphingomonas sp. M1-B02 TaxID=3114300 RepID=UPI00223F0177|nr:hypothetical protein [Sphingomonas sp. S6-11]UZK65358.1 hypothetical protein OKW87_12670 [Sphingomonas sp. S6-11]
MRRIACLAGLLALAACNTSPNPKLEREVQAALADMKVPEHSAFPSLNAETVDILSRAVPTLTKHRAALEAADKALLAQAAVELANRAAGQGGPEAAGWPGHRVSSGLALAQRRGLALDPREWLIPPAQAQGLDVSGVNSAISGVAGASLLGGIADSVSGSGSYESVIEGKGGERALISVVSESDGTVSASVSSNVDIPVLGLQADAKTTFITKSLCPDASGRVEFTIRLNQAGKAGTSGAASYDSSIQAEVVLSVNDNAELADQQIHTRYSRKAAGSKGGTAIAGEADWRSDGGKFMLDAHRPGERNGGSAEAMETSAAAAALALAAGAAVGAERHWQNGHCVRIKARSPGRVDPKAQSSIPVMVVATDGTGEVPAKVTATLSGGASIDPTVIAKSPGTIVHTAPDAKKAEMSIRLDAVSRRGKATETLRLNISEGAYSITGGAGDFEGSGTICDLAKPFTVEGSGVKVTFTPSSAQGGSYRYSGSISGFRLSGTGTYTVQYDGEVATGVVATGPGSVGTSAGMVRGAGDEQYELSPVHNANCG